jgi:alginate O-acetyltransferase complex protein AlgF
MTRQHNARWLTATCSLLIGLLAHQAQADEAALYGPSAPKGSAFIRLYNASSQEASGTVGTSSLREVEPQGSSDFVFMPGGNYTAQIGSQSQSLSLKPDGYYTLVKMSDGSLKLVDEPPFKNRQKALVRLQNLSNESLSLKTADGKTEVVSPVAPNSHGDREINPVKVSLGLFDGSAKVADLKPVVLSRGEVTALYVTGSKGSLTPTWVVRPAAAE